MFFGSRVLARLAVSRKLASRGTVRNSLKVRAAAETLEDRTLLAALYWDPSGLPIAGGGSGTWDTTSADWRSGSPTGPLVAWNNSANDNAIFPASAGAVTLGANITAKSLTFQVSEYVLTGNTLTLANCGRVNVGRGATATIGSIVAGSGGVTKVGGGVLILTGDNSFAGRMSVNGGNLELANGNADQNSVIAVDVPNGLTFGSGIGSFQIRGLIGSNSLTLNDTGGGAV